MGGKGGCGAATWEERAEEENGPADVDEGEGGKSRLAG